MTPAGWPNFDCSYYYAAEFHCTEDNDREIIAKRREIQC